MRKYSHKKRGRGWEMRTQTQFPLPPVFCCFTTSSAAIAFLGCANLSRAFQRATLRGCALSWALSANLFCPTVIIPPGSNFATETSPESIASVTHGNSVATPLQCRRPLATGGYPVSVTMFLCDPI